MNLTELSISKYNGVDLVTKDIEALLSIDSDIPVLDELKFNQYGFIAVKNRVIGLFLPNRNLDKLPEEIGNLDELKYLSLFNNKLKRLPTVYFKNLEYLDLIENKFDNFPIISTNIKVLKLQNNAIQGIDLNSIHEVRFQNLEVLELMNNKIEYIDSFKYFPNLRKLDLNYNHLYELPEDIDTLQQLTELYLWGNNLTNLPKTFTKLNLQKLHLNGSLQINVDSSVFSKLRDKGCKIIFRGSYARGAKPSEGGSARFRCPPKHYQEFKELYKRQLEEKNIQKK